MTFRRSIASALIFGALAFLPINAGASVRTLYVSVPGPLDGCASAWIGSSDFSTAIGDLLYPSAFVNGPLDQLQGSGTAIVSAELNSISPETVNYSIAPGLRWSNGKAFSIDDLIRWWQRAKSIPSVSNDGYRNIGSMAPASDGMSVIATFTKPFANWSSLFRDVQYRDVRLDCQLTNLLHRPTLGFYSVKSVSRHQIVLEKSSLLKTSNVRYGRVVVSDLLPSQSKWASNFVGAISTVTSQSISSISGIPQLKTTVEATTDLTQMAFSTRRANVSAPAFREALSVSVNRQIMVNSLYGAATLSVKPASLLFFTQHTASTIGPKYFAPQDCLTCAVDSFHAARYTQQGGGWLNSQGKSVSIRMVVGPTAADKSAASFIVNTWRVIGVPTFRVFVNSEAKVVAALAGGSADVGVFSRSTTFGPTVPARSYFGSTFPDSLYLGEASKTISNLGALASADLNPTSANVEWSQLDSLVSSSFLARPLFFQPVIQAWSSRFGNLVGGGSIVALLDQVPSLHP